MPSPTPKTPKPKLGPSVPKVITATDMADYLATESDFAFEIRVIKQLRSLSFRVQHGGTYKDEVTGKPRQFDIRAVLADARRVIRMAVECKNLKKTFPMLVSCLPRSKDEAVYFVGLSIDKKVFDFSGPKAAVSTASSFARAIGPSVIVHGLSGKNGLYSEKEPVGKTVAQVERLTDGKFSVNDAEVYQKWAQALSSASDLVYRLPFDGDDSGLHATFVCVIPVLVVPDDTLWMCAFDFHGNRTVDPVQCKRVPIYIDKDCVYHDGVGKGNYPLTHLEVVTFSGLTDLVARLTHHTAIVPKDLAIGLIGKLVPLHESSFAVSDWLSGY